MPDLPVSADLGFAQLDLDRQRRCGHPEVIFGEGKPVDGLLRIVKTMHEARQNCLVTRVSQEHSDALRLEFPQAEQDRLGRTFWLPAQPIPDPRGSVTIITGGSADLPVAHEAQATVRAMGANVELIPDVGVAGLHRLLAQVDRIRRADVVIVVAGMEGALPSVVGGLVSSPVIAVPTSIGYGTQFGGLTPLLSMLNTCAANVTVVNIDAGFKAGYVAGLIVHSIYRSR
jgi:hypothetical protein